MGLAAEHANESWGWEQANALWQMPRFRVGHYRLGHSTEELGLEVGLVGKF